MDKRSLTRLAIAGMMAGSFTLTACEDSTSSKSDNSAISSARTLAEFKSQCEKDGGTFTNHECNGHNECKGHSYQEGKGVAAHDCKGQSSCQGGSCVEP